MAIMLKYVRHKTLGFLTFPFNIEGFPSHADMAALLGMSNVISAGFIKKGSDGAVCHGYSASLNISSLLEDTMLFREQMSPIMGFPNENKPDK